MWKHAFMDYTNNESTDQPDRSLYCPLPEPLDKSEHIDKLQQNWSGRVNGQADMGFGCSHMPWKLFSYGVIYTCIIIDCCGFGYEIQTKNTSINRHFINTNVYF